MAKVLLLLTARDGRLTELERKLQEDLAGAFAKEPQLTVQLMKAPEQDVFYNPEAPHSRPDLVVELVTAPGKPVSTIEKTLARLLRAPSLDPGSLALLMQQRTFIAGPPQPFHYHYLMLKAPGFSVADYNDYYSNYHCRMGFNTPGVVAYSQNYIDQDGSEALARCLGISCREITSISELTMASPEEFMAHPDVLAVAGPAAQDEERFVDRANSVSFCSEVILRLGDFESIDEAVFEQHFPAPNCAAGVLV